MPGGLPQPSREEERVRCIEELAAVAAGVRFVRGPLSDWVMLSGDDGAALIDAGYRSDTPLVRSSVARCGLDPRALRTVFGTYAHTDHIGGIANLVETNSDLDALCAAAKLDAVRGPERE